jgi:hypothetical protein
MKYDFEIQCPKCNELINISSEVQSNQSYHFSSCPRCGKKIKVRLGPELRTDLKKSKSYSFASLTNIHPLDYKLDQLKSQKQLEPDNKSQEQHIRTPPFKSKKESESIPESRTRNKITTKPDESVRAISTTIPESSFPLKTKSSAYTSKKGSSDYDSHKDIDSTYIYKSKPKKKRERPIITPEKRLRIAGILLMIVFILGLMHGINSLLTGYIAPITTQEDKPEYSDISGSIIDNKTGRPISDCKIIILETGQTTLSNTDGQYFISNVKGGIHRISADSSGYIKVIKRVTVDPELMGTINFELDEGIGNKAIDETVTLEEQRSNEDVNIFSILMIIFACFGAVSALLAFRRTFFLICVFCAFISLMSIGFFIGVILAIIAFILITLSTEGFEKTITLQNIES